MRDVAGTWQLETAAEVLADIIEAASRAGPQKLEQDGEALAYVMNLEEYHRRAHPQALDGAPDQATRT